MSLQTNPKSVFIPMQTNPEIMYVVHLQFFTNLYNPYVSPQKTKTQKKKHRTHQQIPSRERSHLPPNGKRKIIFKMPFFRGYLSSLEGMPKRLSIKNPRRPGAGPAVSGRALPKECDPSSRDTEGWTALDWAISQGQGRFGTL